MRCASLLAFVLALVVLAIPLNAPTRWEDDAIAENENPLGGPPVNLLPDSAAVALFHEMGYWWASGTQQALIELSGNVMGQGNTPIVRYIAAQSIHHYELIFRGTRNPIGLEFTKAVFRDEPTIRWGYENAHLKREWSDRLNRRRDASPGTRRLIERDIAESEARGFRPFLGETYEALAQYCFLTRDDEGAIKYLEEARACHTEGGSFSGLSHINGRIGDFYLEKGDLAAAERAFLESYNDALYMEDPYFLSRALAFLSNLRAEQAQFADAESLLVQSLAYGRKLRMPSVELARLTDLASLHESLREYDQASLFVERATALWRRVPRNPANGREYLIRRAADQSYAQCLALKAKMQRTRGEPEAAVATMREALGAAEETADRTFEADLMKGLGDAYAAAGRDWDALRCYSKAVANARKRHERGREAEYLTATGELYLDRKDYRRAEEHLREALRIADDAALWRQRVEALHSLARARSGARDFDGARALLDESISAFERNLADKRFVENRQPLNERIRAIFADLLALESERGYPCDSLLFTAEKARQLRYGERGIRQKNLDASIIGCLAARDWIPAGALVVQYIVTPDRLIVAGMDRRGSEYRVVPISRDSLAREIDSFVAACDAPDRESASARTRGIQRDVEARARSLYRLLLGPIEPLVAGANELCFICDAPLRRLPFGALVPPETGMRFLVEDRRILSSPDLLALHAAARRSRPRPAGTGLPPALLVGRPNVGSCLMRNYPALAPLPDAQEELIDIRNTLGRAKILAGPLATKESVISEMPRAVRIHIATHRVSYPAYSGKSALLFSTVDDCDVSHAVETSLLTESEIERLDLSNADLVVLSACESGASEDGPSPEGMGLAGAFLEAGARTVIATVWPVEDRAARDFVTAFYRELIAGKRAPGAALQAAQKNIIQKDRSGGTPARDIRAWAPYLLIGPL
ncbi:MAG: CHAT domain-containing tetratricopeptide repeat protein [Candidatus Krumholzibacteriaceae bacterium]